MNRCLTVNFAQPEQTIDGRIEELSDSRKDSKESSSITYGRLLSAPPLNFVGERIGEFDLRRTRSQGARKPSKETTELRNYSKERVDYPQSGGSASLTKTSRRETTKVFMDAQQIKEKIRNAAHVKQYDVVEFYYDDGLFQMVAKHPRFEALTLAIIAFNALWITVDTDINHAAVLLQAHPVFQLAEQFFCLYFSFELFVRFKAFVNKYNCLRDIWFVFDSFLVLTMVLETWVIMCVFAFSSTSASGGLGSANMLRMARLLRLSRMARMARLFRAMPELLILIKAMAASLRACFFVFVLLSLMLYTFGIIFRQLTDSSELGQKYFVSVFASMHTLWRFGTLLDNLGDIVDELSQDSYLLVVLFYVFLLLSALTVMNMLIGVLCEVVSAVASLEKEQMTVAFVKDKLLAIHAGLDNDRNGEITKVELSSLLEFPEACKCLTDVGVDVFTLVDNIDFIFAGDDPDDINAEANERSLSFGEFMDLILDLRGCNTATVKDMVHLQKYIKQSNRRLREDIHRVGAEIKKHLEDACRSSLGASMNGSATKHEGSWPPGILPKPPEHSPPAFPVSTLALGVSVNVLSSRLKDDLQSDQSATFLVESPRYRESLNLLKEDVQLLLSQNRVAELLSAGVKLELECRRILDAPGPAYKLFMNRSDGVNRRELISPNSLNGSRPRSNRDKSRVLGDAVQGATADGGSTRHDTWLLRSASIGGNVMSD